ncbi:MAG: toll/interleukin-1 receptor domain-containing protein [Hyphomonas sp.]
MQYDFFLSYRRTDQALARSLAGALEGRGARVWWDDRIEGGEDWREAIVTNLEASEALVILFSEACNASKQLRKELAVADLLDKQIIPVLIEPAVPRGHFLYELAALNWLQIHPDPASKVEELSGRLVAELNLPAAREMSAPPAVAAEAAEADYALEETPSAAASPAPAARKRAAPAPKAARSRPEKDRKAHRNFLAFKWYEVLIALVLACVPTLGNLANPVEGRVQTATVLTLDYVMVALVVLIFIAIIVFPFRYFFRRLRARAALFFHLASVWSLSAVLGILSAFHPELAEEAMGFGENTALFMLVWGVITIVMSLLAFLIYGALHFQRSLRQLKSNTEMIGAPQKA